MATALDIETLTALCDVFVPAVRPPAAVAHDPTGFFGASASSSGTAAMVATLVPELLDEQGLDDLGTLLTALRRIRLGSLPAGVGAGLLRTIGRLDEDAAAGITDLRRLTQVVHYGRVGPDGTNPTWAQLGYPGPAEVALPPGPRLAVRTPGDDIVAEGRWVLTADAVVVGSGAGGGVVAGRLAATGMDVVVLEAGADRQEEDFASDELSALRDLYWRGGLVSTEDRTVSILAGATLGGGTTVNWSNWVAPPDHVRAEWADGHGLDGVDGPDFDADLAAVTTRAGATDRRTRTNGANQRLLEGAKALGWDVHLTTRNVDPDLEDDRATGATGFGDRSGAKQGTLRTWLRDAVAHGARVVPRCTVDRVVVEDGHAAGVTGWWTGPDGARVRVEVTAPTVVLAAGALETPAVLLRSGIGGPAVGHHLRLHPVPAMPAMYDDEQTGWTRAPQGVVVDEHSAHIEGHGYLVELGHWHPALVAAAIDWTDPRDAKVLMSRFGHMAPFLAVIREHGSGTVTLDAHGEAVVHYPVDDPIDHRLVEGAVRDMIELHVAAGARVIVDPAKDRHYWRRGDDVAAFADASAAVPLGPGGRTFFSAHQMGSARMGTDARTSVADVDGQLHETPGVWIGDASAFPTAVGSNPMFTIMALAHRTASRILATR